MHIYIAHNIAYKHIITHHINTYNLTYFHYKKPGYGDKNGIWNTPKTNSKNGEFLKKRDEKKTKPSE